MLVNLIKMDLYGVCNAMIKNGNESEKLAKLFFEDEPVYLIEAKDLLDVFLVFGLIESKNQARKTGKWPDTKLQPGFELYRFPKKPAAIYLLNPVQPWSDFDEDEEEDKCL